MDHTAHISILSVFSGPCDVPAHLLQQQLPIDPHRGLLVLPAVFSQPARDISHSLQAVSSVEQVLDVLGHDLGHILQLVVELVQVLCCTRVLVRLLRALDEGIELDKGIRPTRGREVVMDFVGCCELGGQVGEVGEGEFAWIRAVAYAEEAEVAFDQVAVGRPLV